MTFQFHFHKHERDSPCSKYSIKNLDSSLSQKKEEVEGGRKKLQQLEEKAERLDEEVRRSNTKFNELVSDKVTNAVVVLHNSCHCHSHYNF